MKITVEVNCTAEEARAFFGLPDVQPMQQAVMKQLETRMLEAGQALSPEALLRTWTAGLVGPEQMREWMGQLVGGVFRSPPAKD